jgi:GPH family glycoside/pentoside/hexuronide:cation symporter
MPMAATMRGGGLRRDLLYGATGFVLGVPTIPLFVLTPPLYAETLGIGLTATGVALFFARAFDLLSDPVIGILSDRLNTPWGGRKPLIFIGAVLSGLGMLYLLTPADGTGVWYLGLWSVVLYLGWTLISIPYLAWGAALSEDYQGRARVTSVREGFTLLGILAAGAVPAMAAYTGFDERASLAFIAWGAIAAGIVLFSVLLKGVADPARRRAATRPDATSVRLLLHAIAANKPFRLLIASWLLNSLANGIPAVLFILFMKHVLGASDIQRGALTFVYFLAGVLGIPVWLWLSGRIGKHRAWCAAMILACAAFAAVPALSQGDIAPFAVICVLSGVALGADMALPPAIQADVAEYSYLRSGRDATGTLFAAWSMVVKLAFALSVAVAFPVLDFLGFDPDLPPAENNLPALAVIYSVLPIVFKAGAIVLVWRYPLTARKQEVIRRRIADRNGRTGARAQV